MRLIYVVFLSLFISLDSRAQSPLEACLDTLLSHTVPLIHQDELAKLLSHKNVMLLDARTKAEYDVSHIKGAEFIDYEGFTPANVAGLTKDNPVVVYCSVGYRSEKIGEKLQELGFTDVRNLYGGIFEWKNNGYKVVNNHNIPTDSVHTYNADWGRYLIMGVKVY